MISSVMTDPFAVSCPSVIVEAARALNATISNCWPRISERGYEGEVLRTIATCWLNLDDGNLLDRRPLTGDVGRILGELRHTVKMLQSLYQARGTKPPPGIHEVLKEEPKLEELFS